jgi:hypothetical protein
MTDINVDRWLNAIRNGVTSRMGGRTRAEPFPVRTPTAASHVMILILHAQLSAGWRLDEVARPEEGRDMRPACKL